LRVTWGEQFLINSIGTLNINQVAGPSISYEIASAGGSSYFDRMLDPIRFDALSDEQKEIHLKHEHTRKRKANVTEEYYAVYSLLAIKLY
jgi:hypothetical protein